MLDVEGIYKACGSEAAVCNVRLKHNMFVLHVFSQTEEGLLLVSLWR